MSTPMSNDLSRSSTRQGSPNVEVVICTKDRPVELRRCIAAVWEQTRLPDRVRVIDASESTSVRSTGVDVVRSAPGLTRQRNLALETSHADLIVFLDDDTEIEPGYVEAMVRWFDANPACVVAGGNITDDPVRPRASRLYRRLFALADADGRVRPSGEVNYLRHPGEPTKVDVVDGSNLVLRRSALEGLRFDESFEGYGYMEDAEFCLQAGSRGELWTIPGARLVHTRTPTGRVPDREYVRQVLVNGAKVYAKHRDRLDFSPTAFARRVFGRSLAYLGIAVQKRSLQPVRGVVDGLSGIPDVVGGPLRPLSTPANIAVIGVLLTPLTLVLDYRVGSGVISDTVTYTPYAEGNSLPVSYEQVFGWTQVLWIALGAVALSRAEWRTGFRSVSVFSLVALLALICGVTAALDGIDVFTIRGLGCTLVPLIAMAGVLLNPWIGSAGVRRLLVAFAFAVAVITAGTLAFNAVNGDLGQRFDLLLFGPPTETGLALALTLVLLPAAQLRPLPAVLIGTTLLTALVLTETRGALVAFAAGAVALALLVPPRRVMAVALVTVALAGVVALFALTSDRPLSLGDDATDLREAELERHWQLFLDRPAYGYGLSDEAVAFSTGAHNTVLAFANAAGIGAALLWLTAWFAPVARGMRSHTFQAAVAAAVLTCALVGWFTTGTEPLIYTPPTNLLPLLLGVGLAVTVTARRPS